MVSLVVFSVILQKIMLILFTVYLTGSKPPGFRQVYTAQFLKDLMNELSKNYYCLFSLLKQFLVSIEL